LTPFELLRVKTMRQEIRQHLKYLTPRESGDREHAFRPGRERNRGTLDDVGKKFKVTRERIRQIQEIALRKLRRRIDTLDSAKLVGKS